MEVEILKKISDGLVDKLLKSVVDISAFFTDVYKLNSAKNNYLNKIAELQYVRTINEIEDSVSLYDFYVPPQLLSSKDKNVFKVNTLEDIKTHRKILISGIVGQGKSILMRNLAISEVLEHKKIPLFFELRNLNKGQNLDSVIKKLFLDWLEVKSNKIIDFILCSGSVTIFFDGFDEIHIDDMPKIVKGLEELHKKYPKLNFIVSSRPEIIIENCTIFQNFKIQKLDFNAQVNIINALIFQNKVRKVLVDGIRETNISIRESLVTPLMVNLYVFIYKHEKIIPEHPSDFYDRLFDLVLRKHDNTKIDFKRERATKLDNNNLKKVVQLISYMCCKQNVFAFDEGVFRRLVGRAVEINGLSCSVDDLIYDLTSVLCFIVREGYLFAFIHKSIPEYFAAEFIRDKGDFDDKLYNEIYNNYSEYENVCNFLKIIDEYNFNKLFLVKVFDESIKTIESKIFLDRTYFSFSSDVPNLKVIVDDEFHEYFNNYLRANIGESLFLDIKNNFPNIKKFSASILSRSRNSKSKVMNQSGVYKDYYSSVSDNRSNGQMSDEELEQELIDFNFRKIKSVTLQSKFSNTLIF